MKIARNMMIQILKKINDTIDGLMRYIMIYEYQYEGIKFNQFFNSGEDKNNVLKNRMKKQTIINIRETVSILIL